jgi:hypothetical protein
MTDSRTQYPLTFSGVKVGGIRGLLSIFSSLEVINNFIDFDYICAVES